MARVAGKGIPPEVLQQIRDRIDIVEVVSRFVSLKKAGQHFKGLCPFHSENTPSFTVNPSRQLFHCFGCGQGGDAIAFLMQHEKMDFLDAVRELAQLARVPLPEPRSGQDNVATEAIGRERYEKILALARTWFCRQLRESQGGHAARQYLRARGIDDDTMQTYELGYAPAEWHGLSRYLHGQGVASKELESCGLVVRKSGEGEVRSYDRFRARIMFPIKDLRSRVIAFGGRVLVDEEIPKYLNSPETPYFHKGQCLFGLDDAREAVQRLNRVLIVEGYFDVIGLAQAGIRHVAAPLGTALTEGHLALLRRFTSTIIMVFDGDAAGVRAVMRALDLVANSGLTARVVRLPSGEDPDSYVRVHGPEAFQQLEDRAVPLLEFAVRACLEEAKPQSIEERVKSVDEILRILRKTRNPIERDEYTKVVSEQLGIRHELLLERWAAMRPRSSRGSAAARINEQPSTPEMPPAPREERALIQLLVSGMLKPDQIQQIALEAVTFLPFRRLMELAQERVTRHGHLSLTDFQSEAMSEPMCRPYVTELALAEVQYDDADRHIQGCLMTLMRNHLQRKMNVLIEQLRAAEKAQRQEDIRQLLMEIEAVTKQKASMLSTTALV